jgi:hypothetical protein
VNAETRAQVRVLISGFMEKWIANSIPAAELERLAGEGVSLTGLLTPFHDALVSGITLLGERSFSTRLGNLHEKIAAVMATESVPMFGNRTTCPAQFQFFRGGSSPSELVPLSDERLNRTPFTNASRFSVTSGTE